MDLVSITNALNQAAVAAQDTPAADGVAAASVDLGPLGGGLAMGLGVAGVGIGVGLLAAKALEGAARQPEVLGRLQTMMILAIAFIEALALACIGIGGFVM